MATKIRLQRNGRKSYAFYSIVIADVRAPRDGKFTEKIGTYNPNTNPATVDLNFERALHWVMCGAQPTDTVRNILSKEGVYMKKHLLGGVAKGAFTEAEAEAKFEAWKNNKQSGLATLKAKLDEAKKAEEASKALFAGGGDDSNMPTSTITPDQLTDGGIGIMDLMVTCGLAGTKSEARRLVQQGGVSVNDEKVSDIGFVVTESMLKEGAKIKKGKKKFHKAIMD